MKKLISLLALVVVLASCSGTSQDSATKADKKVVSAALKNLQNAQPLHTYGHSQIKATLQTAEDIQANGENTWTYGFEMGFSTPVFSCPSIGLPVPATDQLTNPVQAVGVPLDNQDDQSAVISQADPTGVYQGDTSATYVICIANSGEKYLAHIEGEVFSFTQKMVWNGSTLVPAAGAHSSVKVTEAGK